MAYAPIGIQSVSGPFVERDHGKTFEYVENPELVYHVPAHGGKTTMFPHLVYVGPLQETRMALVLKTVAHVVTGEWQSDGKTFFTVEKWTIKNHREYAK